MDATLVPPIEALLADGPFEVWHVDFNNRKLNYLGSRELVFQALCRNTFFKEEAERQAPIIRVLTNDLKFVKHKKNTLAIHIAHCYKSEFITLDEAEWLANKLGVKKEVMAELQTMLAKLAQTKDTIDSLTEEVRRQPKNQHRNWPPFFNS